MVLVVETYGYVVQFIPYQSVKQGKQVAYSTKWGLGENFVLWLMESLTPTVSFIYLWINISQHFVCLLTLELPTFEQQLRSAKFAYADALLLGTNDCKNKERGQFEQRTSSSNAYSRTTTKSIQLLQQEHVFCQQ